MEVKASFTAGPGDDLEESRLRDWPLAFCSKDMSLPWLIAGKLSQPGELRPRERVHGRGASLATANVEDFPFNVNHDIYGKAFLIGIYSARLNSRLNVIPLL